MRSPWAALWNTLLAYKAACDTLADFLQAARQAQIPDAALIASAKATLTMLLQADKALFVEYIKIGPLVAKAYVAARATYESVVLDINNILFFTGAIPEPPAPPSRPVSQAIPKLPWR